MPLLFLDSLPDLFAAVQLKPVFPDGKTFPDCLPLAPLDEIGRAYEAEKNSADFDLSTFVHRHYSVPKTSSTAYHSDPSQSLEQHIEALWDVITRQPEPETSSLIPLPFPYVVPGGRFREIYYWDSYFTMLGLRVSGRIDLMESMVANFSYLIDTFGYVPNGNRTYFLGRSQPPFYSLMVRLLSEEKGSDVLIRYRPQLEAEYAFWMRGATSVSSENPTSERVVRMPDGSLLNRYWDAHDTPRPESYREDVELAETSTQPSAALFRHLRAAAESGWDFSSRWFADETAFASIHTTDFVPVDLNCLLLHLEEILADAYADQPDRASEYHAASKARREAIQRYCWDEERGFFFDYDTSVAQPARHFTLAGIFPLSFGVATPEQAERVVQVLEKQFLKRGGLVTTLAQTGQQWDAPNGWAPLHWMAYRGLHRYGQHDLARRVKTAWLDSVRAVYAATGKLTEKYDVCGETGAASGGEYPNQDGFGWTNGVTLALLAEG